MVPIPIPPTRNQRKGPTKILLISQNLIHRSLWSIRIQRNGEMSQMNQHADSTKNQFRHTSIKYQLLPKTSHFIVMDLATGKLLTFLYLCPPRSHTTKIAFWINRTDNGRGILVALLVGYKNLHLHLEGFHSPTL